jgi:DNA-binding response OmpR family regulator
MFVFIQKMFIIDAYTVRDKKKVVEQMNRTVLIVDDDKNICELLRLYLEKDGYQTLCAYDGKQALELFEKHAPDLILLDVMLPYMSGMDVCREIRKTSNVPILMLTAKGETEDKISGLELGADDYIVKPFETKEVLARMKAVLRRSGIEQEEKNDNTLRFEKLQINLQNYELWVDGNMIDTPPKELELLYFLASNPGRVFTRNQLLDQVWSFDFVGDSRTVDVHIKRLRKKLEGVSPQWCLRTVWGIGYKFEVMENHEEKSV